MSVGTESIDPVPGVDDLPAGDRSLRRSWVKLVVLAAAMGVLLTVVYFSPLRDYLNRLREVSQQIRGFGALAPLVVMGGVALLVAIGFPRLIFCLLAGMALGFWSGLLWAQLGTMIGNYALFLTVRGFGRDWAEGMLRKRSGLRQIVRQRGMWGVLLARQVPVPGVFINLACALLPIRQSDFLLGTILGQLPQAIPCTLIGAGLLQASFKRSIGVVSLAVVVSFVAWFFIRQALRTQQSAANTIANP
jgi:uncharacterized membrane protein YdjX (TVP38/TMEM64 family)